MNEWWALDYQDDIRRTCAAVLNNCHDAEDAAQDCLLRLWEKKSAPTESGARAYAVAAARNMAIDASRRPWMRRRRDEPVPEVAVPAGQYAIVEYHERVDLLCTALLRASVATRVAAADALAGLSHGQVAAQRDITPAAAKMRAFSMRQHLRQALRA